MTDAKQKSVPERLWFNPLNCEWGEKYFACTVTSEQANSMQIAYVPESTLQAQAQRIQDLELELQKSFDRAEEAARIACDAEEHLGDAVSKARGDAFRYSLHIIENYGFPEAIQAIRAHAAREEGEE